MVTLEKVPFIEATEPEVVELHRSQGTISIAVEGPAPLAVHGFACVLKREGEYLVHAALYCKEIKRALVYAVGSPVDGLSAYRQLLAKALEFTAAVGCRMEAVNLKYSAAMRSVILKDIAVLAPPGAGRKFLLERASEKKELEQLTAEAEKEQGQDDDSSLSPEQRMERRHRRDAQAAKAEAAARRLAAENRIDELAEAWSRKMAPIVDAINGVKTPAAALRSAGGEAETRIGELEEKVRFLEKELAAERAGRKELEKALQRAEKQVTASGEAARKADAAEKISRRVGELEEMLRLAKSETEAERAEKERLQRAKAAAEQQLEKVSRALQQAEERLKAAPAVRAGTDDRLHELEESLRQAEGRSEFLRQEVERLAAAKALAEKRGAELAAGASGARSETAALSPAEARPLPLSPRVENGPDPRTIRRPPPPGAFFRVDWDLAAIPCRSLKEICEIHRSIGMVKLSLEGYPNQYCAAFIAVVKKGGQKEVYMPFRLSASNELLVYVPAGQPDNSAAFAKAMKEAGKFLQVVGMDIEPVEAKSGELPPEIESLFAID